MNAPGREHSTDARAAGPHRDLRRERLLQAVRSTLADPAGGPARRESLAATSTTGSPRSGATRRPPSTGVALVAVGVARPARRRSGERPRPGPPARRQDPRRGRRRRSRRTDLVPRLGLRAAARPLRPHASTRAARSRRTTWPPHSACSTCASSPATRRWRPARPRGAARAVALRRPRRASTRSPTSLAERSPEARRAGLPARGRPQGGARRAARRRRAARAGGELARRLPARRDRPRHHHPARRPRRAARRHRAARGSGCCWPSRTPSPSRSACRTPTRCSPRWPPPPAPSRTASTSRCAAPAAPPPAAAGCAAQQPAAAPARARAGRARGRGRARRRPPPR